MRTLLAATALLMTTAATTPASAVDYPWCAQLTDMGATNCGFVSWQQCMTYISGIGGSCSPDPFYAAAAAAAKERPARRTKPAR